MRKPIGYIVEIEDSSLLINLIEEARGHVASHSEGVSSVGQPGDLIGIEGGSDTIVGRVRSIAFAEPREVHLGKRPGRANQNPLRQMQATVIGYLRREEGLLEFIAHDWRLPALGASAFPLTDTEVKETVACRNAEAGAQLVIGSDTRNRLIKVSVGIDDLLARHFAILGASGQGKTHFVAAVLQNLVRHSPRGRAVIFDVNGEYAPAFQNADYIVKRSEFGRPPAAVQPNIEYITIPYYALGRHGLSRLLLPSERTQRPALRFAIDNLRFIETNDAGARVVGQQQYALVDDCRIDAPDRAKEQLDILKEGHGREAPVWPNMKALACLIAEWSCIKLDRFGNATRDGFLYDNVQTLINRINGFLTDDRFAEIVDVNGGPPVNQGVLDLRQESESIVSEIFGPREFEDNGWRVHIIDLRRLSEDLMPFVLGSLLELFASELFRRGPGSTHPTLLVLEEAHHYLRQLPGDAESGQHSLAYERLAKEGRKFNLSLLLSTQRPAEISPTVLSQCGTWAVFRLTNETDQRAVVAASESSSSYISRQISGLARGEAILFGAALTLASRINVIRPNPEPDSADAPFVRAWSDRG